MTSALIDVKILYDKDKCLKKEDVDNLLEWASKQQHLPKINELQAILFLHSCYYRQEFTKTTVDTFFTFKTLCPDMFTNRDASSNSMQIIMGLSFVTVLSKKTPEGYSIIFIKFVNSNSDNFNLLDQLRYVNMVCMLHLYQEGPSNGYLILVDLKEMTFGHVLKLRPLLAKHFFYYLQEAMPVRLKGIHFFNPVPFMDKILALIKPFLKKEILDALHVHETFNDLTKFAPQECLPVDYGGSEETIAHLHEKIRNRLTENIAVFDWEETLTVNESKRMKESKINDFFGIDGSFKKLEID
ncbi:alpha-tocopherol transfer protein-like [Zophobas morio]|uniref:alpha-tocopherol transfer protein-like n=1 Tax=Zophobas morio TaxID=2755281 RepID=UPI003083A27B